SDSCLAAVNAASPGRTMSPGCDVAAFVLVVLGPPAPGLRGALHATVRRADNPGSSSQAARSLRRSLRARFASRPPGCYLVDIGVPSQHRWRGLFWRSWFPLSTDEALFWRSWFPLSIDVVPFQHRCRFLSAPVF